MPKLRTEWESQEDYKKFKEIMRSKNQLSKRLTVLYKSICQTPFKGRGGPHQLHGNYENWWARHISGSNVLIYNIDGDVLLITALNINYHKSPAIGGLKDEDVLCSMSH
jgi:Txe/YoeB family toxin of toxin-antitoxin system